MGNGTFTVDRLVDGQGWKADAAAERGYAVVRTPVGELQLTRSGTGSQQRHERWRLLLGAVELLRIDDASPAGLRWKGRKAAADMHGCLAGARPFTLRLTRRLRPSRREVRFDLGDGSAYRFGCGRRGRVELTWAGPDGGGKVLAERRGGRWGAGAESADAAALVALFEVSGLRRWTGRPVLRSWRLAATLEWFAWALFYAAAFVLD
ncbi:hypothetical protein [Streptacidiphilus monticola]|uniref:Uncharacterized protein n=1 Tax=Streptacidiphilus monticola TaxID=2161674 RepID=A0ABW1G126_9ACTN